jgi:hypothetical protein
VFICLRSFCCASPSFNEFETQQKERRQHSSAPGPFVGEGNFVACLSSEILLHVGRRKFCCVSVIHRDKVSIVGVLSSAFVAVQTPTKEGRQKRHFRRHSRVGVPTLMNADNEVSVGRSGGGRLRYGRFGGEDTGVLPVAGGFERGVPVAGGCSAKRHVVVATSLGAVFVASCC